MTRLTLSEVGTLIKAHCMCTFKQDVCIIYLKFEHGRWSALVAPVQGKMAIGMPFGMLLGPDGEVLEDALDID